MSDHRDAGRRDAGRRDAGRPDAGPWQRRWQPLLQQWVIVSSTSAGRPWSGALSGGDPVAPVPVHDADCYLCPRVTRANGAHNPDYRGAFAFDNDFPSLSTDAPPSAHRDLLARTATADGRCRVLCWSERHDATLASLPEGELRQAVELWRTEYRRLATDPAIANVLIFENKGVEIGVSNLHPHGQVYATGFVTDTAVRMRAAQAAWHHERAGGREAERAGEPGDASLLPALLAHPHTVAHLIVEQDAHFAVIVPFAARFAYETWIVPHRHIASTGDMDVAQLDSLARLYQRQVRRYDLLFDRSAPNVTLLHNAPVDDHADNAHWCFHLAFHPPLRDPVKMKFLAGFESGANNIVNPVRPEDAAATLRGIDVARWSDRFAPAATPATKKGQA